MELARILVSARALLESVFDSDEENEDEEVLEELHFFREAKPIRIQGYYDNVIPQLTDKQFQSHFRLTRPVFVMLENILSPLVGAKPYSHKKTVDERKQILMVIWLMANLESYRSVAERFDDAKSTLWHCFYRVIRALNMVSTRFVSWANVSGAVDTTYIPIKAPKENPGISLQIILDSRIFRNSDFYRNTMENPQQFFEDEEYIIGDKAYPVLKWCIPPYINRGELNNMHRNFNTIHARMRQCVERTFALLYGRVRRLQSLDMNRFDLYAYVIKAACVLHNICLLNRVEENLEEYIREGLPVAENNHDNDPINNQEHVHINDDNQIDYRALVREGTLRRDALARQLY